MPAGPADMLLNWAALAGWWARLSSPTCSQNKPVLGSLHTHHPASSVSCSAPALILARQGVTLLQATVKTAQPRQDSFMQLQMVVHPGSPAAQFAHLICATV